MRDARRTLEKCRDLSNDVQVILQLAAKLMDRSAGIRQVSGSMFPRVFSRFLSVFIFHPQLGKFRLKLGSGFHN